MISEKEKKELKYYLEQYNRMYNMFDYDIETLNVLDADWGSSYEVSECISSDFIMKINPELELVITVNIRENNDRAHYGAVIVPHSNKGWRMMLHPDGDDYFDSLDDLLRFIANGGN